MAVVRPRWSSGSFLLYAGVLTLLAALDWGLAIVQGKAALAGWAALATAVLLAVGLGFRRAGRAIAAGVFAVAAVVAFGALVAALERWAGWFPKSVTGFDGVHWSLLLEALLVAAAALAALAVFRFPLLVLIAVSALWFLVADLLSNGGDWTAALTFLVGLGYMLLALGLDRRGARPYAFWLHVAAGLAIGGSLVWFWHSGDFEWILVALTGALYVGYAWVLDRSSWAVLGAVGLFLAAGHFAVKWGAASFAAPFVGDLAGRAGGHRWAGPLVYVVLGLVFVVLGLAVERRRATPAG